VLEIVRHGAKEDRAWPARSALPVVDVVAGVPGRCIHRDPAAPCLASTFFIY